jgi:tetratricopeptide (TPR) repeat protein
LQLFEPIAWVEEILAAANSADVPQLPRIYTAASLCCYVGRLQPAVTYAARAVALQADPRYDSFDEALTLFWSGAVHVIADGDLDRFLETCALLARRPGLARVIGYSILLFMLPAAGRIKDAQTIAVEGLSVARAHANPVWVMFALIGAGRAFADSDAARALGAFREALDIAREQSLPWFEAQAASQAASLETAFGDLDKGLELFDLAIDAYQRAGNHVDQAAALAALAVFFDRNEQPEIGATVYGIKTQYAATAVWVVNFSAALDHMRQALGDAEFEARVDEGYHMAPADALRYARDQVELARSLRRSAPMGSDG